MRIVLALVLAFGLATPAVAERSSHMSCGSAGGLVNHVLLNLTAMTQLLNNSFGQTVDSKDLAAGFCGLKKFPPGSTAQFDGIAEIDSTDLIYVIFRVEYFPTVIGTGKRSSWASQTYAVDAVVSSNRWRVGRNYACGEEFRGSCLIPRSCNVLNEFAQTGNLLGFTPRNRIPFYVKTVGNCGTFTIN